MPGVSTRCYARVSFSLSLDLEWSQDHLSEIWTVTNLWRNDGAFQYLTESKKEQLVHPMHKLIVAMVIVETRNFAPGPPDLGIGGWDITAAIQFWELYDGYVGSIGRGADGSWAVPDRVECFL